MAFDSIRETVRGLAQRLGGTRAGVLIIGRVVSHLQRQLYRATGGRLSLTGHAPVLLLTTTGRRTGRARTVPLLYARDGERMVICNVNPGFERPNPWILNLRAQPHAKAQIGRHTLTVRAREASASELDRYWPRLTEVWPAYRTFVDRGANDRSSCSSRMASHDAVPTAISEVIIAQLTAAIDSNGSLLTRTSTDVWTGLSSDDRLVQTAMNTAAKPTDRTIAVRHCGSIRRSHKPTGWISQAKTAPRRCTG